MLVGSLGVLMGMLAMFVSRRSVYFRLVMLTDIVMMCRFKVMMGGCLMVRSSSVMVLAGSVFLFFRHLNRHVNILLSKNDPFRHEARRPDLNPLRPGWCADSQPKLTFAGFDCQITHFPYQAKVVPSGRSKLLACTPHQ
jgi:hypothetical protein